MNFRKNYYGSLGVKTIDVRVSVESSLQGEVLSIDCRIQQLCLWIRIPHMYRPIVWKVLLGILPVSTKAWSYVSNQRKEQYNLIKEATSILLNDPKMYFEMMKEELTPKRLACMLIVELQPDSAYNVLQILESNPPEHLIRMAKTFLEICDDLDEVDAFWMYLGFIVKLKVPLDDQYKDIYDLQSLLNYHSTELCNHLKKLNIPLSQITTPWYKSYFCGVLNYQSLEGIFDIIIGGESAILPYIALSLFLACSRKLLACKSDKDVYNITNNISKHVDLYAVAQTSVDIWEKPLLDKMNHETKRNLGLK
ncbi:hypothetical protein BC833DRAFT_523771 [Globomyces pollinis-pini]|nr:hypothetical protein BC833DRAFT_523771 [Globomyces pollinis-pini]